MQLASLLFPDVPGLRLDTITTDDQTIHVTMTATHPTAMCPVCGMASTRVHSRYQRTLHDLPWAGHTVAVQLTVRRFVCANPACDRTIFVERLGSAIRVLARRTDRLVTQLGQLVFRLSAEAGARLSAQLGMSVSASTLIRLQRQRLVVPPPAPHIIGVDDWAMRKGRTYGALIVDLERRQPIALLPDSKAETFAAWLRAHPTITVISRDRAGNFAEGARVGAPQAIQIADRWHLFGNLGDALQRLLARYPAALRAAARAQTDLLPTADTAQGTPLPVAVSIIGDPVGAIASRPVTNREQQFQEVLRLHAQGWNIRTIAHTLHLNRRTVTHYVASRELPKRGAPMLQVTSTVRPYLAFLERRWQQGCQNKTQLWQESQAQGYQGSRSSVYRALKRFPPQTGQRHRTQEAHAKPYALSPRQAMWLLVRAVADLTEGEQAARIVLEGANEDITEGTRLARCFQAILRQRDGEALEPWLQDATNSGIVEFQRFAASLRRDAAAVQAAFILPWSNGQLEAQVNRLKAIKRIGYGRAKFDLLRQRVLATE